MASNMYKPFQYQDALVSSAITMKVLLFATLTGKIFASYTKIMCQKPM